MSEGRNSPLREPPPGVGVGVGMKMGGAILVYVVVWLIGFGVLLSIRFGQKRVKRCL